MKRPSLSQEGLTHFKLSGLNPGLLKELEDDLRAGVRLREH
jgi:hypothetical protein